MALMKCKECGKEHSDTAQTCPHCGFKRPKQVSKLVTVFVVLMAVVWVWQSVTAPDRTPSTPTQAAKTPEDWLATAKFYCRELIEKSLHDPKGAEWPRYRDMAAELRKDGTYRVQLTVRAKNAFNATRLATFDCIMRPSGPDSLSPVSVTQLADR